MVLQGFFGGGGGGMGLVRGSQALYLEGQGDLVSRLITPIAQIVALIIPTISLLTKSP